MRKISWYGGRRGPVTEAVEVVFTSFIASLIGFAVYPLFGVWLEPAMISRSAGDGADGVDALCFIAAHVVHFSLWSLLLAILRPLHGGLRGAGIFLWTLWWRQADLRVAGLWDNGTILPVLLILGIVTCSAAGLLGGALSRSMALSGHQRSVRELREQERDFL